MMRDEAGQQWPVLGFRFDRLREHVGSSGLFTCRAHDLLLDRGVSLRVCTTEASALERDLFDREADALQRIGTHSAIVALNDVTDYEDVQILSLADVRSGAAHGLEPQAAVSVVIGLAGAVETAHRVGVLHGAIEPDNLWTDNAGRVLLAGFGGRVEDASPPVLRSATPHTAPEVLLGEPLDPAVDVYGLGSTLYELIAGTSAIRSYAGESTAALSLRILTGAVVRLPRSGMPFELADVIGWSMAVDRGDRPPSAAWLAEELGRIQRTQAWARTRAQVGATAEPVAQRRRGARHRASRTQPKIDIRQQ